MNCSPVLPFHVWAVNWTLVYLGGRERKVFVGGNFEVQVGRLHYSS